MRKRLMGIDFGEARIGVALSDPLAMFAQPHATIENSGWRSVKDIVALAAEKEVRVVVVGMPYELDGSLGPQAKKVTKFTRRLERELASVPETIEVVLWDERLTTAQAERVLIGSGLQDKSRSAALDRVSAALILDSYLCSSAHIGGKTEILR